MLVNGVGEGVIFMVTFTGPFTLSAGRELGLTPQVYSMPPELLVGTLAGVTVKGLHPERSGTPFTTGGAVWTRVRVAMANADMTSIEMMRRSVRDRLETSPAFPILNNSHTPCRGTSI